SQGRDLQRFRRVEPALQFALRQLSTWLCPLREQCPPMNGNKEKYKKLCTEEPSIPIFSQDWWLDATAGSHNWDVALVENRDNIAACMPYVTNKRAGLKISTVPPLTYCLGPW